MNHLAHVVLAGPEEGLRLGAFLGDHIKGRQALLALPQNWADGVILHRRIDSLCDQHPAVRGFLAELNPPWRRYGGILLDVLFDHMLTRHWARFGTGKLTDFSADINRLLARYAADLPDRLRLFSAWARQRDLWCRYGEREVLNEIFHRLAQRHGRTSPLAGGLALLDRHDQRIEAVFVELFSDLAVQAADWRDRQSSISSM
jgi:acyl carrier protein phosphodiesterase